MSPLLLSWIVLILTAFTVATLIGIFHPCIPDITKERLKYLEVEKGYKGEIVYRGWPTVEIMERYGLRSGFIVVDLILLMASILPVCSLSLLKYAELCLGSDLALCRIAICLVSLFGHSAVCVILTFYIFTLSEMRFSDLEKYYKSRYANVKIKRSS